MKEIGHIYLSWRQGFGKYAVKVFKDGENIGYIKKIHNKVFYKTAGKLRLTVKAVEQNGWIKRIFVKVAAF